MSEGVDILRERWTAEATAKALETIRAGAIDDAEDLRGIDLGAANLAGADLFRVRADYARFDGADLEAAVLQCASLQRASLCDASLQGADITMADLEGACLERADLRGARMFESRFRNASLRGSNLTDADLSSADLRDADLRDAIVAGVRLTGANVSGTRLPPIERDDASVALSDTAAVWLWAAGWRAGRQVDVNGDRAVLLSAGYRVNDAALAFLRQFSGMDVGTGSTTHHFDVASTCSHLLRDRVAGYEAEIGESLCPVGELSRRSLAFAIAPSGATYELAAGRSYGPTEPLRVRLADDPIRALDIVLARPNDDPWPRG